MRPHAHMTTVQKRNPVHWCALLAPQAKPCVTKAGETVKDGFGCTVQQLPYSQLRGFRSMQTHESWRCFFCWHVRTWHTRGISRH